MSHYSNRVASLTQRQFIPSNGFYGDGWSSKAKKALGVRYTNSDLRARGAVVGIYDQYDAVADLLEMPLAYTSASITDITKLPDYENMKKVPSTDAGARMKAAYWLAAAYRASRRTLSGREGSILRANAESLAESGLADGVSTGSGLATGQIVDIYTTARALLIQNRNTIENASVYDQIDAILKAGAAKGAVSAAIAQKTQAEDAALAAQPGWTSYIPGYGAADSMSWVLKAAGAAALLGGLAWAFRASSRSNPQSEDYDEETKEPMPPEAEAQLVRVAEALFQRQK